MKMFRVCTCTCSNSDHYARNIMRKAGIPNWSTIEVIMGKNPALAECRALKEQGYDMDEVIQHIGMATKFICFIGSHGVDDVVHYADVGHGGMINDARAQALCETFAL